MNAWHCPAKLYAILVQVSGQMVQRVSRLEPSIALSAPAPAKKITIASSLPVDARSHTHDTLTMTTPKTSQKPEELGESSNAAEKKAVSSSTNGSATYELPWYVCMQPKRIAWSGDANARQGSKSTAQSSLMMLLETQRQLSD